MLTDVWVHQGYVSALLGMVPSLLARRNECLPDALVRAPSLRRLGVDAYLRMLRRKGWDACIWRNNWYEDWVARQLESLQAETVFSYTYTARQAFKAAKRRGMRCILDQIDGAVREEQLWRELSRRYHHLEAEVDQAPERYWDAWREELDLADVIVVNSGWSKRLIVEVGADENKIVEIPLVYGGGGDGRRKMADGLRAEAVPPATRHEPRVTGAKRRLRALFLGSVCLRKGVGQLLDAIRMLKSEPVDFTFAGPNGVRVPDDILAMPHVRFLGPVDRATAERLYGESDVFLFPTLSDGFGRTQLEALGHGCPVIASTNCGQVIEHRVNGLVLEEITPEAIAEIVMTLVRDQDLLAMLKSHATVPDRFHPRHLAPALLSLEGAANNIVPNHP